MELIKKIREELENLKLIDIKVFDLNGRSSLADFYLTATAESVIQMESIRYRLIVLLKEYGYLLKNPNEDYRGGWLIMDFGDLVINVFTEEARAFYQLDRFLETGEVGIEDVKQPVRI